MSESCCQLVGHMLTAIERPASVQIRDRIDLFRTGLNVAFARLWKRGDTAPAYVASLTLVYQIIRASVPLMEVARDEAERRRGEDSLCGPLADYFERHIAEERNHDVWTLEDLFSIGVDTRKVTGEMPRAEIARLVGAQYYWVRHHHPVALLGYISVLEGEPPSPTHIDHLQARSGLPDAAFRMLRYHSNVDPHHKDDLDALLDSLPLGQREIGWIGVSAIQTLESFQVCVEGLLDELG